MRGTVLSFDSDRSFGWIKPDRGGKPIFVHASNIASLDLSLRQGDVVEFDLGQNEKGATALRVQVVVAAPVSSVSVHDAGSALPKNCFIVMPFGRTAEEVRWFSGWYSLVIEKAVRDAGFKPVLAAAQQRPDAINDDIRAHLALDPMVVVDLGGLTPQDEPNPNVMYELGIRHAFNLPHVIMAWEGQRLPFDISNQRVIMERRDLMAVGVNRDRLRKFITEAAGGNHYKPMDAVGRAATLDIAESRLSPDSVLGALVEEVRSLRSRFSSPRFGKPLVTVSKMLGSKDRRNTLRQEFIARGGTEKAWSQLLVQRVESYVSTSFRKTADKTAFVIELAERFGYYEARTKPAGDTAAPAPLSNEPTSYSADVESLASSFDSQERRDE